MDINLLKLFYINWSPTIYCNSRHGAVFYTDDNKASLHYYRQTPVQRKVHTMSCVFLNDDPEKQSTKFDDLLLVSDTALQCFKSVPDISCLWGLLEKYFYLQA